MWLLKKTGRMSQNVKIELFVITNCLIHNLCHTFQNFQITAVVYFYDFFDILNVWKTLQKTWHLSIWHENIYSYICTVLAGSHTYANKLIGLTVKQKNVNRKACTVVTPFNVTFRTRQNVTVYRICEPVLIWYFCTSLKGKVSE